MALTVSLVTLVASPAVVQVRLVSLVRADYTSMLLILHAWLAMSMDTASLEATAFAVMIHVAHALGQPLLSVLHVTLGLFWLEETAVLNMQE